MRFKQKVDVLIVRTVPCEHDSRVSKFLFHYQKNEVRVGIVCISRSKKCSRSSTSAVPHYSTKGLDFNSLPFPIKYIPGVWKIHRPLLYMDYLLTCVKIFWMWRPTVLHGCDLDGFLITKFAFPFNKKRVFEVLDPWTTMTSSSRIARLENNAFQSSKVLVMPAFDSRIKIIREKSTSFSNFMDVELANQLIADVEKDNRFTDFVHSLKPYVLTGGIISSDTKIDELIYATSEQNKINLVVTCDEELIRGNGFLRIPTNVFCIGKQEWGKWLYLMKNCNAIWIYYSQTNNHFASHISPNKYWEAVLFGKKMLVNQISQFCDRIKIEGPIYEIGENFQTHLPEILQELAGSESEVIGMPEKMEIFEKMSRDRTHAVKQILHWALK